MSRALLVALVACKSTPSPLPAIEVDVALPGASADTMASAVTTPLERQFGQLRDLEDMTSASALGTTRIHLGFARDVELDVAQQAVQAAINAASNLLPRTLPAPPTYATVGTRIARLWSSGPTDADIQAQKLSQIAGVGRVDLCGAPRQERWLGLDPVALAGAGLVVDDVVDALRMSSADPVHAIIAMKNGAPIRVSDVAHERAPLPPECRAHDETGDRVALDIYARPGADADDVLGRIAAIRSRLPALVDAPRLPDEVLVQLDPGVRRILLAPAIGEVAKQFSYEQRDDSELVHVELAGDGQVVASAALHLRHVAGVLGAGVPTTVITLDADDPAQLVRVAKDVAARFTARGALVATEGFAEVSVARVVVDRDTASRLGVVTATLDRALMARSGILATTIFTQLDMTRVFVALDGDGPTYVRSMTKELVPLDAITHFEQHREPTRVLHAGQFPAVRLYTTDGDLGELPPTIHASAAPYVDEAMQPDEQTTATGTYAIGELLGKGGQGEVWLAHDKRIGRNVALKRLKSGTPSEDDVSRFLREARVQARLDHPAIVPVYDLGRDQLGRPFFAMKRLTGRGLDQILSTSPAVRQKLLRAFVEVCRAIDFAHSRGVVHRDLKPANIILGDFGEVYVIDWGVARVIGDVPEVVTADIDTIEGTAPAGKALGTPGYMAPEQMSNPECGRPADIYALGSILFEILANESLHPRGKPAIDSTMSGRAIVSPALRRPDRGVVPKLDALCAQMLSMSPNVRPTAHRCAEAIDEFLDGDRDFARRRTMANELVTTAQQDLADDHRVEAMRAASRALALDPDVGGAAEVMMRVMLEPPRQPPPELLEALHRSDAEDVARHAKAAIPGYLLMAAFFPIIVWNGVLSWPTLLIAIGFALSMGVAAHALKQQPIRSFDWMVVYGIGNAVAVALLGRVVGELTVVPALLAFITASVITYPMFLERPIVLAGIMLGGLFVPLVLEAVGILERSWELRDGGLFLRGVAMNYGNVSAVIAVLLACTATIVMAAVQSTIIGRAARIAQHKLVAQAWHLSQLLPTRTRALTHA